MEALMRHHVHWLIALLVIGSATAIQAQEQDRGPGNWGVGIEGGIMALGEWEIIEPIVIIQPWFALSRGHSASAARQDVRSGTMYAFSARDAAGDDHCGMRPPPTDCFPRLRLEFPIVVKFAEPDPWRGRVPEYAFPLRELQIGPAVWAVPSVALVLGRIGPVSSSVAAGAGVFYERGRDTEIQGEGTFTTESIVAPAVAARVGLNVALSPRINLTLGVRGFGVFAGDTEIATPSGAVTVAGQRIFSQSVTAGLTFSR
jgi:hypothetical protein